METTKSLHQWFATSYEKLYKEGETARAHLLREAYYQTICYEVYQSSLGYDVSNFCLIGQCSQIYEQYCWQYRIT